jgi:hypothetical protein
MKKILLSLILGLLIFAKPVSVFASEDYILLPFPIDATIQSSGFADPNNIIVQQDGNFITKTEDTATMKVIFNTPITSAKNILYFQPRFYYASEGGDASVTCHYTVNTDQGDFSANTCGFPPDGYPNGYSDNLFNIDLPNNIHQVNSFEFTINSPHNSGFLLGIDYMEFFYFASDHFRSVPHTGGPYQVVQGGSIQLNGTVTNPDNPVTTESAWDLDNDGSYEINGLTPIFSAATLTPGAYPIKLVSNAYYPQFNIYGYDSTIVTVLPNNQLTSLSPAKVWLSKGLHNIGTKFDLKAEVYKDSTLVSSGQVNSVAAGSGGFNNATLETIPFNSFSPIDFPSGSQLSVKVYARTACTGSLLGTGKATLWYNDSTANSDFGATIGDSTNNYYLRNGSLLSTTIGSGPKQSVVIATGSKCSAFKQFGTWTITP